VSSKQTSPDDTRSWAGRRGETTFQTLAERDEIARGVDYLDELGVGVVWLTPIHPAVSADRAFPGGGPHGCDITDYFDVADDLVPEGEEGLAAHSRQDGCAIATALTIDSDIFTNTTIYRDWKRYVCQVDHTKFPAKSAGW